MKSREELLALWKTVVERLKAAFALLPTNVASGKEGGAIADYEEFLEHNELELALDQLEALGDANRVPDGFWRELLAAAQLMELDRHAQRLSSRLPT